MEQFPKRKKGRPKGSFKKKPVETPCRNEKVLVTPVFVMNRNADAQIILNRGGVRSSKSYSVVQLLVEWFFTIPKIKILMLRKWQPSLRLSIKPLIWEIIDSYNLRYKVIEVKRDMNLWSPKKGLIHIGGLDEPEKIKCYHPDTEILTDNGFKFVGELEEGELVATMNPSNRNVSFMPIEKMYSYQYSGNMISPVSEVGVRKPFTGFCVTPEHKMLYSTRRNKKLRFIKAKNMAEMYSVEIPRAGNWKGRKTAFYKIPRTDFGIGKKWNKNRNGRKDTRFSIVPFLKFLGWYLSEGCISQNKTVFISQTKKEGREQFLKDMKNFPYSIKESNRGFAIHGIDLCTYLSQFGKSYNKFIPRDILELHPTLLIHLFNALVAGDGSVSKTGYVSYLTTSHRMKDDFSELAIRLGKVPIVRDYTEYVKNNPEKFFSNVAPYWVIQVSNKKDTRISKFAKTPYKGTVYCPCVPPYHNVLIRYDNRVMWCGQSSDWNIILMEEATEFTYEDFVTLKLRLSTPTYEFMRNKMFLNFNPIDEYHWIKTKIVDEKTEDFVDIHSNYLYNPFLAKDYVETVGKLQYQDPNYWRIFGQGEWGRLEHIIYTNWSIVPYLPEGEKIFGLDFGFVNPTALVQLNVDGYEVGVQQKIYQSGLTNQDLIRKLHSVMSKDEKNQCPIYADSAEPQRIEELNREGFWVIPADKSVKDGIDYVKRCRLRITDDSDNVIKEVRGYSYRMDRNGRVLEEPVKFNDHALDGVRYGLHTHALGNIRRSNVVMIAPSFGEVESFSEEEMKRERQERKWLLDREHG